MYAAAAKSLQSCPTLHNRMDCRPPGFSVHGIFQARVLEWGATAFSKNQLHSNIIFLKITFSKKKKSGGQKGTEIAMEEKWERGKKEQLVGGFSADS